MPDTISNPFESPQKFQGRSAFWFTYIDEVKIKYFLKLYFSQTLIFAGFLDFLHLSNVYKLIERVLLAFDFIANWYWKKQRNLLAMNYLYILFLIFYITFFKREFWIFSTEHFDRLHSTKFSIATREFYIWEALCQVKHPC